MIITNKSDKDLEVKEFTLYNDKVSVATYPPSTSKPSTASTPLKIPKNQTVPYDLPDPSTFKFKPDDDLYFLIVKFADGSYEASQTFSSKEMQ